jgi:ubiquinone/menaquinone biosynthesis C-methylase UbiE
MVAIGFKRRINMTDTPKNSTCNAHVCSHKLGFVLDNWFRKLIQNPRKVVGEYINAGDRVIDFGCGPGFFSIAMAEMVGSEGKVIAVDLQPEMLAYVKRKAKKKNLENRMIYHQCPQNRVGLELQGQSDFMLAIYMVHETPEPAAFFKEVKALLKKGGKFLIVEPKMHVNREKFAAMIQMATGAGFTVLNQPHKKGGRSLLLTV